MRRIPTFVKAAVGVVGGVALFVVLDAQTAEAASAAPRQPVNSAVVYTIKQGDSLSVIAQRNRVSVGAIATLNAINNVHKIVAGQQLLIPVNGANVSPARTTAAKVTPKTVVLPNTAAYSYKPSPGQALPAKLNARPERVKLRPAFDRAAKEHKVSSELLQAMAWNESGWQNTVTSSTGAVGIGQLMPATVQFVNHDLLSKPLDPSKAEDNIRMSAAFLRYLLNETNNDARLALAAYYQGLNSIRTKGLYTDTDQYIRTVLALQRSYF